MPEVRNCKQCKKIFMYSGGAPLCDACKKLDEEDFDKVRKFLRDFPGAVIQEVSDATGVSAAKILKYLKDDRIEVSADSPIAIQCEACGVRIRSGRFCQDCSKKLARDMISAGKSLQDAVQPKDGSTNSTQDKDYGLRYKHRSET